MWDLNNALPELAATTAGTAIENYLWGVGSLGFTTSAGSFYDLQDDQGSTVGVISSTGVQQSTTSYGPFGNTITSTNLVGTAPTQLVGWQGQVADSGGLYNLRAREYNAATGTFISTDPLPQTSTALAVSPYVYAGDQPTISSDPSGECAAFIFGHNCSEAGNIVRKTIDGVALGVGVVCVAASFGVAVPCDAGVAAAATAWGVVSYVNGLLPSSGSSSESQSSEYNYQSSYYQSNGYYGGTIGSPVK
jgi:RHS repeat-associated protein